MLGWVRQVGRSALTALILLASSEILAMILRRLHTPGPGWGLDQRIGPDAYEVFVGAMVGAFAVLLALFFTTLGVVATTTYAEVSDELRAVFLRERENTAYVSAMVRALVFGTALLAAHAVGYHPYSLSIAVFALLSLVCVLGSAALGVGLFSFFDVTRLAAPLPRRFQIAAERAAALPGVQLPGSPGEARKQAQHALRLQQDTLGLVTKGSGTRMTAADALTETLKMWTTYAQLKPAIPTSSAWFSRSRQETNWLTLNPFELQDPLTANSAPTTFTPDLNWAERELTEQFVIVLRHLAAKEEWPAVVDALEPTGDLAFTLVAHLQVQEALLLNQASSAVIDHAATPRTALDAHDDAAPDHMRRDRARTAALQAGLAIRGRMWLGLAAAARRVQDDEVGDRLEAAAHAPNNPAVGFGLPISRDLRDLLDTMADGLAVERQAHREEISPGWWLRHHTARTLTRSLYTTAEQLCEDLHAYLTSRIAALPELGDAEVEATFLLAGLNAVRAADFAHAEVRKAAEHLGALRHDAAEATPWPTWEPDEPDLKAWRTQLLLALAPAARRLPGRPHLGDEPDLLGRSYLVIVNALFEAVMDGDEATAAALFPTTMDTALRAHRRILADLGDKPETTLLILSTAPLIDIMLISGYALFIDAVDGSGIWATVRESWNRATEDPALARTLIAILNHRHRFVPGDIRRQSWERRFDRWTEEGGLAEQVGFGFSRRATAQASPLVAAVLNQGSLSTYLMADLLVVEYLTGRPGGREEPPCQYIRNLRDAITAARASTAAPQEPERD